MVTSDKLHADGKTVEATFTGLLPAPEWIGPSGKHLKDTLKPFLADAANRNAKYRKADGTHWKVEAYLSAWVEYASGSQEKTKGVEAMKKAVSELAGDDLADPKKIEWPSSYA